VWLLNESNSVLADATPDDLSATLMQVLTDDILRQRLSADGKAFAETTDWMHEADKVARAFEELMVGTERSRAA
jgi:hypothetical protein